MTLRWRPGYDDGTGYVPGKLTLRKGWQPMDPDAAAYITAVETADNQALEERVKIAIDKFVLDCKADGIWNAIKASCILAGARTLNGALVPLVGTAPTNFNFVSGDYNRKTGLVGDGSTKYLDSNRTGNADPQNSCHLAVHLSSAPTSAATSGQSNSFPVHIGSVTGSTTGTKSFFRNVNNGVLGARHTTSNVVTGPVDSGSATGLVGINRSDSASFTLRVQGTATTYTKASQTPNATNLGVYRAIAGGDEAQTYSNARLAFYSIGESLNLALLDARVTALINAFGAAIP